MHRAGEREGERGGERERGRERERRERRVGGEFVTCHSFGCNAMVRLLRARAGNLDFSAVPAEREGKRGLLPATVGAANRWSADGEPEQKKPYHCAVPADRER